MRRFVGPKGQVIDLRPLGVRDLDAAVMFANLIVKERKVNRELGVVSLDHRVTRKGENAFLARISEGVRKRNIVSVAAFHGGIMVGNCDISRRIPEDVRHTGVLGIVVSMEYRGIGLGEAMIREAMLEAAGWGIWLVELQVFENNSPARRLYEKLGFRVSGRVPDKILRDGKHIDEVLMYADLRRIDKSTLQAGGAT